MISESELADRIAQLRNTAGWSYQELARRLSEAGMPMDRSSLQKIEKGSPRRKITVDEVAAFSEAFEIPVVDLLGLSPEGGSGVALNGFEHRRKARLRAIMDEALTLI